MGRKSRRPPYVERWAIVAFALVSLLMFAHAASVRATMKKPSLGVQVRYVEDQIDISWVQPDGIAWNRDIRPGAVVTMVNGKSATSVTNLDTVTNASSITVRTPAGASITADANRGDPWGTSNNRLFTFFTVAACFMMVGAIIFVFSIDLTTGSVVFSLSLAAATALITGVVTPFGAGWALNVEHVAVALFCSSVFLLFLVFPVNRLSYAWGRLAAGVCLFITFSLIGLYVLTVVANSAMFIWLGPIARTFLAADFIGAVGLAIHALTRRSAQQRVARPALTLIVLGILAGLAPFYLLTFVPLLFNRPSLLGPEQAIVVMALLPVGLGAAVLSRQFPGITRLVQRMVVALAVWTTLVTVYTVGVYELYSAAGIDPQSIILPKPLTAVVVTFIGATFAPAQFYLRRAAERVLFHDIYNYPAALERLSNEIARLDSIEALSLHVLGSLAKVLDLKWAALAVDVPGVPETLYRWGTCPEHLSLSQPGVPSVDGVEEPGGACRAGIERGEGETLLAPLLAENSAVGTLMVGPKLHDMERLPEDESLVATLAPLVATALQNAMLTQNLERQVATLADRERELAALSLQLMQAQEEERRRIALDLHDDPLQRAILLMRDMSEMPDIGLPPQYQHVVEEIAISLRAICTGLRPPLLDDLGLVAALEWLVSDVSARSDLVGTVDVDGFSSKTSDRLAADLEVALYRVALEALTNCLKHAQASHVHVHLQRDKQAIRLRVVDDGRGPTGVTEEDDHALHLGIVGMRERLRPWNGVVRVEPAPAGGTEVTADVVLRDQDD